MGGIRQRLKESTVKDKFAQRRKENSRAGSRSWRYFLANFAAKSFFTSRAKSRAENHRPSFGSNAASCSYLRFRPPADLHPPARRRRVLRRPRASSSA